MTPEQRKSLWEQCKGYFKNLLSSSASNTNTLKKCILEGDLEEAKTKLKDFYDTEPLAAKADAAFAFGVLCTRLDFIFRGYDKLKLEDAGEMTEWKDQLSDYKRMYANAKSSGKLEDIIAFLRLLKSFQSRVTTRTEQRQSDRNSSLLSGAVYATKMVVNGCRWWFLPDTESILYLAASVLSGAASASCFVVAYKYHGLYLLLHKEMEEVLILVNEVNVVKKKKEEEVKLEKKEN